jgi:hypothetical protein
VPEVRRLLRLLLAPPAEQSFGLHWSRWRRQRQAEARRSHYRARLQRLTPLSGEVPLSYYAGSLWWISKTL